MYGINSASCLEDVAGFSVTQCFIHDPMHILFEGVSASELKMLLKYLVIYRAKVFKFRSINR